MGRSDDQMVNSPGQVAVAIAPARRLREAYIMMAWVYWGLCVIVLVLCAYELATEKNSWKQATAALVMIPLLLRVLLWK